MKKTIKPIIPYMGSKRTELDIIKEYEPKHIDKFVDVFGGACNVSLFYKNRGFKVHYNDLLEPLYKLIKTISNKEDTEKLLKEYNNIDETEETFYKIFDKEIEMTDECRFLYLTSACFRSCFKKRTPQLHKGKLKQVNRNYLKDYHKFMKEMEITNKDYKDILEKYKNDENVFLYLDPPYISKTTKQYGNEFTIKDLEYIKEYMSNYCDCKVMLHIDFTGYTYHEFKDMIKYVYPFRYVSSCRKKNKRGVYEKYHMIIRNF